MLSDRGLVGVLRRVEKVVKLFEVVAGEAGWVQGRNRLIFGCADKRGGLTKKIEKGEVEQLLWERHDTIV